MVNRHLKKPPTTLQQSLDFWMGAEMDWVLELESILVERSDDRLLDSFCFLMLEAFGRKT